MKFSFKRIFSFVLAFAMVISLVPELGSFISIKANAATTKDFSGSTVTDLGMSATDATGKPTNGGAEAAANWKATGNNLTGALVGATDPDGPRTYYFASTSTLTLTNNKTVKAELSFDCTVTTKGSNYGTITVNGQSYTANTTIEDIVITLEAGASTTITLSVPQREKFSISGAMCEANGASISITNLKLTALGGMTVTFGEAENGSYTVTDASGAAVTVPGSASASTTDRFTLTATPATGYAFAGWYSGTTLLSGNPAWTTNFAENIVITPKFMPTGDGVFGVGTAVFADLETAAQAAASTTGVVILLKDHTLTGAHTVPFGVTLLIPKAADQTVPSLTAPESESPPEDMTLWVQPSAFRTLTLAQDATLTVNGNLEVGAKHAKTHGGNLVGGAVFGQYGCIDMEAESNIVLNSGANLFAWGYVLGDGTVTANDGANIYEKMQVTDYRGGTNTSKITLRNYLWKDDGAFPFSQYYIQNVEAEMVLKPGAVLLAHAAVYLADGPAESTIAFMGEGGMFSVTGNTDLIKKYDPSTDRLIITAKGENADTCTVNLGGLSISMGSLSIDSSHYVVPINSNFTIYLQGCTATMSQELLLQPGAEVHIAKDAVLRNDKAVYIFDLDQWGNFVFDNVRQWPLQYVPSLGGASTRTISSDTLVDLNGTLIANAGVYTTEGGARIISSEHTGIIKFATAAASAGTVYQLTGGSDKYEIPAIPALLTNGNAATAFTSTAGAAVNDIFVYDLLLDMWVKPTGNMELNYDANGGTGGPEKQVVTLDNLKGGTESNQLQIPSTKPTKTNAKFLGWALSADGPVVVQPGDLVTIGQSHTLYAKWEITQYTITFLNEDGSVFETLTVPAGQEPTAGTPTKADNTQYTYNFAGWDADGDGKADDVVAADADATYKAVYNESLREYKITWMDANGTELYSYMMPYGTQIIEPDTTPTRAKDATYHYTFVGWDSNNDGAADAIGTVSGAVTYKPVFTAEAHSYDDGVVTKDPTTTEEGIKTYTCSACGNSYTESIDKLFPGYDFGQTSQIWLIEPWALRANLRVYYLNADGSRGDRLTVEEMAEIDDYGVYFIRESDLGMGDVTQSQLTIEDIINNVNVMLNTKADGRATQDTGDKNCFSSDFDEGIYTYELSDSVFVLYYIVENGVTYYAPIRERNLSSLVNNGITDTSTYTETERAIFEVMAKLEKDILEYRGDTAEPLDIMDAPTLGENPLGTPASHSLSFGHTMRVSLIEPWGLQFNGKVRLDKEYDDYGVVVYYDSAGTIEAPSTAEELLALEGAYVFSYQNGDAEISLGDDGRTNISALYNKGLYTYQMTEVAYVMFYVQEGDNIYCGPIKERTIQKAIQSRLGVAEVAGTVEEAALNDMLNLYDVVYAHRKSHGLVD